ncbi:MAG: hypothetical protein WCZ17_06595 [Candidatus Kapaibacterium sp.]
MKELLSIGMAIVTAVIFVSIILFAFKISFAFISFFKSIVMLGMIAVFAIPLYIIVKKKLFK